VPTAKQTIPEWDLLLAASSADPAPENLARICTLAPQVDWQAVLRLADHHGVFSLLYQNLQRSSAVVPAEILSSLRKQHELNVHKSLFLTRELFRILDCLGPLGIEALPYKGVVLAEACYGDMALRQSGDIDLFVRESDLPRILAAVRELGYVLHGLLPDGAEPAYVASGYEWTFDTATSRNLLELQWQLQPRFYAVDYEMKGVFDRAVLASAAGRQLKTPCAEDLLLVLSVHAAKHVWGRLIWVCDIAQILQRQNPDWSWIQDQAHESGIERILHITLGLSHNLLGARLPALIEEKLRGDSVTTKLIDEISGSLAGGISHDVESLSYFRLMMRLRERRPDRMRFLSRLIFTPGPGEWEAIRLPAPLSPLYRVVRLGRLAARLVKR